VNSRSRMDTARAALWALTGSIVVLFIFFAALGGIDPAEARIATIVIVVLAILWLVHFFRRRSTMDAGLFGRSDRERRGF